MDNHLKCNVITYKSELTLDIKDVKGLIRPFGEEVQRRYTYENLRFS